MSRLEQEALLALFSAFRPGKPITAFDELSDGNVLLEVMHTIDETHFKGGQKGHQKTLSTGVDDQDNWVLRMNTLKRLYRLLLSYPINSPNAPTLAASTIPEPNFNAIARSPKTVEGTRNLILICRLCVAAGSLGSANERVIAKIQSLDESVMAELMRSIERVMESLPKGAEEDDDRIEERDASVGPTTAALAEERDELRRLNEELRVQCEQMTDEIAKLSVNLDKSKESDENLPAATARQPAVHPEVDKLRADLTRAEDGLAETEAALEKQTALVEELSKTVDELRTTALEASRLRDQVEDLRQVEDRLHKSENVIEKYKRKLEESAGYRRELRSMEEVNSTLVSKNTALEEELRALSTNKTLVDNYKTQVKSLEKKVDELSTENTQLSVQLEDIQTRLVDTERERDTLRDEVQVHQTRLRELDDEPSSSAMHMADQSLDHEMDSDSESDTTEEGQSRAELKVRILALEKQLAAAPAASGRIEALEQLLAEAEKSRQEHQEAHAEAKKQNQIAQAKLESFSGGKEGADAPAVAALQQKLDEVLAERDSLLKDKQESETSQENLMRQLRAAKAGQEPANGDPRPNSVATSSTASDLPTKPAGHEDHSSEERQLPASNADEQAQAIQSQLAALQKELSVAKRDSRSLDSRYRLEHQLVLAAWHDLGARIVRDHVGVAGLRRPAMTRPPATSWLARQRKHQDDALFTR